MPGSRKVARIEGGTSPTQCPICPDIHQRQPETRGLTLFECDKCSYVTNRKGNLTRHMRDRHGVGTVMYKCDQCSYEAKQKGHLTQHMRNRHGVGTVMYKCDQCSYEAKQKGHLTRHMQNRHEVGTVMYKCDQCSYVAKQKGHLTRHMQNRHEVGTVMYKCDQCSYVAKQKADLTRHMARMHVEAYGRQMKKQEQRVEDALKKNGWEEFHNTECMGPPGHYKREHKIDFLCSSASVDKQFARIDFVITLQTKSRPAYVFLEIDEDQHRFGYCNADGAGISCDAKRMSNVMASITQECSAGAMAPPFIYWLRYNPNAWHVDGELIRVGKETRETRLLAFLDVLGVACDEETSSNMEIGYAFYDSTDGVLEVLDAQEYPSILKELVENLEDLGNLNLG